MNTSLINRYLLWRDIKKDIHMALNEERPTLDKRILELILIRLGRGDPVSDLKEYLSRAPDSAPLTMRYISTAIAQLQREGPVTAETVTSSDGTPSLRFRPKLVIVRAISPTNNSASEKEYTADSLPIATSKDVSALISPAPY